MDLGVVSIVSRESKLVELNILQHLEAPVIRKSFSCNVTKFQQCHKNENLNFSSPPQPELLELSGKILVIKESLHTNLFVSRTSLMIERSTDRFWREFWMSHPRIVLACPLLVLCQQEGYH